MLRQGLPAAPGPARRKRPERRASVRFAPPPEIICYWSRDGLSYTLARVCDVSAGGACLVIRGQPFEPGTELAVELINGGRTFLCARTLRVLRIYQGGGRDAVIGGAFDRKLDYDELLPFIV
jgi:PilZ domain